jgi:Holliday junction resolvase RusA-like endonuclease
MAGRITFTVPGTPVPKGRPRLSARIVPVDGVPTALATVSTPPETVAAEAVVLAEFRRQHPRFVPLTAPVRVSCECIFEVPKSWPRKFHEAARAGTLWHTSKPDEDNLGKLVKDALNTHAYVDDGQISMGPVMKRYGSPERTVVTIEALEQPGNIVTPAQKELQARVAAAAQATPPKPRKSTPLKAGKNKRPDKLQAAIDRALARDAKPAAVAPTLFGDL